MRYKKAPILEAVLEFRWDSAKSLDQLVHVLSLPAFKGFEPPTPRMRIDASIDIDNNSMSHSSQQLGYAITQRDGSEVVFLEEQGFVFVQRAPYDRWDHFSRRALSLLAPTVATLEVSEFTQVALRFINRIDIPPTGDAGIDTNDYVTIKFDGPREDLGIIDEFQIRVVKPTMKKGLSYALIVATTPSPLSDHSAILLDIAVFTKLQMSAKGKKLKKTLDEMRTEKNDIFEKCLTDKSRGLFGGFEK